MRRRNGKDIVNYAFILHFTLKLLYTVSLPAASLRRPEEMRHAEQKGDVGACTFRRWRDRLVSGYLLRRIRNKKRQL